MPRCVFNLPGIAACCANAGRFNGADHWHSWLHCAGHWYLLLSQPLDIPGVQATILVLLRCHQRVATRNAQLRAWLAASTALLALGGAAAVLASRLVTRPR